MGHAKNETIRTNGTPLISLIWMEIIFKHFEVSEKQQGPSMVI